jgi:sugar phosphate isomerase/epimerase
MNGRLGLIHAHDSNLRGTKHLPPGDGTIDWRGLLIDFRQSGFDKPIILEIADSGDPEITMSNARRGRAHLKANYRRLALSGY